MFKMLIATMLLLTAAAANATKPTPEPIPPPTQTQEQSASAEAASSSSASIGGVISSITVGGSVSSADNSMTYQGGHALAQGSLYLVGCGFSANAGHSESSGASFLGVQFITRYCRDQAQIANEAAFGNIKTACEMNRLTPAGQRNLKRLRTAGLEPEPCPGPALPPVQQPPTVVVLQGDSCASKERAERIFEKCMEK